MNQKKRIEAGEYLKSLITKSSTGMGEDSATIGGNLTQAELLGDILKADYMEGTVYEICQKFRVSEKANGLKVPIADQSKRTTADGILGGIIPYEITEGSTITLSKPKFTQTSLPLNQIGIVVPVTNALVEDSTVLVQYLGKGLTEAARYKIDNSILYGDGSTNMYGIAGSTSIGTRATYKMTGMAYPYTVANLRSMVDWYYGGKNGTWLMGHTAYHEMIDLYSSSTIPLGGIKFEDGDMYIYCYKVIRVDTMRSRDIVLGDFTQYVIAEKPTREDISEHLYFTSNQSAFRTMVRINGCPTWSGPITEEDGDVNYAFVVAGYNETDNSSTSSSSSTYIKSTSSSSSTYVKSSSSTSSSSTSSNSSSSSSSSSSSTSSESTGALLGCSKYYTGASFNGATLNGRYRATGTTYNSKAVWQNPNGKYLWAYDTNVTSGVCTFVISDQYPVGYSNWLAYSNAAAGTVTCPDDADYIGEDTGTMS